MNRLRVVAGNSGRSLSELCAIGGAALVAATVGVYAAFSYEPTLFGMPIRPDSLLRSPPADLSCVQQVGVSFLRGLVMVLHFTLWTCGAAAVAAIAVALLQGLRGPRVSGRTRASRLDIQD